IPIRVVRVSRAETKGASILNAITLFVAASYVMLPIIATAQGTHADYERANTLGKTVTGKIFRASVKPNWIDADSRFWYRNDLPDGKREFWLVDPAVPARKPAFDHSRMAATLTKLLGKPITADKLPIEHIAFTQGKAEVQVQVREKT